MDFDKKMCHIVDVDGFIENGKQFDIEVNLPEDNRNVIYGIIRDCYGEPVKDAVVKLIEVCGCERKPVSHTFTDKEGEFVFGPLCPDKNYEVQIWANRVKHFKICADGKREGKCLKGVDMDTCKFEHDDKKYDDYCEHKCKCKKDEYEEEYWKNDYDKCECKKEYYDKCDHKKDECEKKDHDKCECKKDECEKKDHDKCECKKDEHDKDECKKNYCDERKDNCKKGISLR